MTIRKGMRVTLDPADVPPTADGPLFHGTVIRTKWDGIYFAEVQWDHGPRTWWPVEFLTQEVKL